MTNMINSADKLFILEDFIVDRSLPKFSKKKQNAQYTVSDNFNDFSVSENSSEIMMRPGRSLTIRSNSVKPNWFVRLFWWLSAAFRLSPYIKWWSDEEIPKQTEQMSVEEFFISVNSSTKELQLVKDRAAGYERAMVRAKQGGQQALFEQLVAGMNAHRMETYLMTLGLPRYLEEADLVRFYKQSKKGLRLDWVKNFTRQIPQDVLDKKIQADETGIFDNYVILHYDPTAKSWAETQEEKNRRKDPILFGLMDGCRRLFFIGDWKDEFCDLTLDQIADALGDEAIKDLGIGIVGDVMIP